MNNKFAIKRFFLYKIENVCDIRDLQRRYKLMKRKCEQQIILILDCLSYEIFKAVICTTESMKTTI